MLPPLYLSLCLVPFAFSCLGLLPVKEENVHRAAAVKLSCLCSLFLFSLVRKHSFHAPVFLDKNIVLTARGTIPGILVRDWQGT